MFVGVVFVSFSFPFFVLVELKKKKRKHLAGMHQQMTKCINDSVDVHLRLSFFFFYNTEISSGRKWGTEMAGGLTGHTTRTHCHRVTRIYSLYELHTYTTAFKRNKIPVFLPGQDHTRISFFVIILWKKKKKTEIILNFFVIHSTRVSTS